MMPAELPGPLLTDYEMEQPCRVKQCSHNWNTGETMDNFCSRRAGIEAWVRLIPADSHPMSDTEAYRILYPCRLHSMIMSVDLASVAE